MKKLILISVAAWLSYSTMAQNSEPFAATEPTTDHTSAYVALQQFDMALCLIKTHAGLWDPCLKNITMYYENGYKNADFDLLAIVSLIYWKDRATKIEILYQSDKHMIFRAHGVFEVPFPADSANKIPIWEFVQMIKPQHKQLAGDLGCMLSMKIDYQGVEVSIAKK